MNVSQQVSELLAKYDYEMREEEAPYVDIPDSDTWRICCLVGQSGTGKTSSLRKFGDVTDVYVDNEIPVIESGGQDIGKTADIFRKCGFNSIPSWALPYSSLSNGEKYRVQIALKILRGDNIIILDEFGSYLDETSSIFLARVVKKLRNEHKFLISTLNPAIAEELEADVLLELGMPLTRRCLWRDSLLQIQRCHYNAWEIFKKHHYMNHSLMKNTKCFLLTYRDEFIGFSSVIPFPTGNYKNAYREHRTVVLPNFQGVGLGVMLSDLVASIAVANGKIYFSKTVHPSLGEHREKSSNLWTPTAENRRKRRDEKRGEHFLGMLSRISYCHRYTGEGNEELKFMWDDNPLKPKDLKL